MENTMFTFWLRLFTEIIPTFLMAEPICYLFGAFLFLTIIVLFHRATRA